MGRHTSNRLKRWFLGLDTLQELFKAAQDPMNLWVFALPKHNLPQGAKLVHVWQNVDFRGLWFVFEHPSFDEVPEGHDIPVAVAEEVVVKCDFRPPYTKQKRPQDWSGFLQRPPFLPGHI